MARREEQADFRQNVVDRIVEKSGLKRRNAELERDKLSRSGGQNMLGPIRTEVPLGGVTREILRHVPPDGSDIGWYQSTAGALIVRHNSANRNLAILRADGFAEFPGSGIAPDFHSSGASLNDTRIRADNANTNANGRISNIAEAVARFHMAPNLLGSFGPGAYTLRHLFTPNGYSAASVDNPAAHGAHWHNYSDRHQDGLDYTRSTTYP